MAKKARVKMEKSKTSEADAKKTDAGKKSDNLNVVKQEHNNSNKEKQKHSDGDGTEGTSQAPINAADILTASSSADTPAAVTNSFSSCPSDAPISNTNDGGSGTREYSADNNDNNRFNWLNQNPNTGDFYSSNYSKNYRKGGGSYNSNYHQGYRNKYNDNSRYRFNRAYDRNNTWKNQKSNTTYPRRYKSRWDNPNPSTNYSKTKTSSFYEDDNRFCHTENVEYSNKSDGTSQYNQQESHVSDSTTKSPTTKNKIPTSKDKTSTSKEKLPTTKTKESKDKTPTSSKLVKSNNHAHDSTPTRKNLSKTFSSAKSKNNSTPQKSSTPKSATKHINANKKKSPPKPNKKNENSTLKNCVFSKETVPTATEINATPAQLETAQTNEASSPVRPKITLIPLAKLIRNELLDLAANDIISSTQPDNPSNNTWILSPSANFDVLSGRPKGLCKPNLVPRRRNISCCSNSSQTENLVEKVVNMDKSGIKNVINSSGTKYDEALKIQARKRLRDEIRKQLKSMNLEKPRTNTGNIDSVADDIVNSIDIPQTVMDEIRKAFGIELYEESAQSKDQAHNKDFSLSLSTDDDILQDIDSDNSAEPATTAMQSVPPVTIRRMSTDLMSRIKAAEQLKSFTERSPPKELQRRLARFDDEVSPKSSSLGVEVVEEVVEKESSPQKACSRSPKNSVCIKSEPKRIRKKPKTKSKKSKSDVIVIESSDSSDSSTSNSSSSSSSSSTSSEDSDTDSVKSTSSSVRRRRQRQKVISENVVCSFETLILPNLSEAQRDRYKEKYSATTSIKLHFISCICTSEYNTQKFSKIETAKLQRNLKAEDNATALEFLMREIVNVFNKQKKLRQEKEKSAQVVVESETEKPVEPGELMTPQSKSSTDTTKSTNNVEPESNRISTAPTAATTTPSSKSPAQKAAIRTKTAYAAETLLTAKVENKLKEFLSKRQLQSVNKQASIKRGVTATAAVKKSADKAKNTTQKIIGNAKRKKKSVVIAKDKENPIKRLDVDEEKEEEEKEEEETATREVNETRVIEHNVRTDELVEADCEKVERKENVTDIDDEENSQNLEFISTRAATPETQKSQQRQWKSPGEKKCIDDAKSLTTIATSNSCDTNLPVLHWFAGYKENLPKSNTTCSGLENVAGLAGFSSLSAALTSFTQNPHLLQPVDLDALKHDSLVGEAVVSNLREIDVKLMELHKRKMFIEEMILKLQKDKMEADLQTIKLQNEKFILLNTAMTANATAVAAAAVCNTAAAASPASSVTEKPSSSTQEIFIKTEYSKDCGTNTEAKIAIKKLPAKRKLPAEKLRNRKKRCQRDILIECTPSETVETKATDKDKPENERSMRQRKTKPNGNLKKTKTPTNKTAKKNTSKKKASISIPEVEELPTTTTATPTQTTDNAIPINAAADSLQMSSCPTYTAPTDNLRIYEPLSPAYDYSNVPTGYLEGIKSPVTQIRVFEESIIASSEDGNLYKFNIRTLQLEKHFAKHSEAITQMYLCQQKKVLYTTSLDGYLKKSSIENFDLDIQTVYLEEPLQSIDVQWGVAFIGSRWGNIFTYDIITNHLSESLLCSSDSSIIALKATKEGPRKILIVSSKGNQIHFRDATCGLLLRSLTVPENLHIFSLLLDYGCLYCGTQKNEIYKYDFTTGTRLAIMNCGNGAVSIKLYKGKFLFVGCYDGFVYVLDKESGCQIGRFPGSGKLVLALEIAGDKLLTSAKDNTIQIIDIPKYIVAKTKV